MSIMTRANLENGEYITVYGDISVHKGEEGWAVNFDGPVVAVSAPHLMEKLQKTAAASLATDNQPGHVLLYEPGSKRPQTCEYLQIPPGVQTQWILDREDAALTK